MLNLKINDYITVDGESYIFKVVKQNNYRIEGKCIYATGDFRSLRGLTFRIRKSVIHRWRKVSKLKGELLECG